jgi:hypothetical protein
MSSGNLEAEDLSEQLAGTRIGHHLALNQIHSQRLDTGSILGSGTDSGGKGGSGGLQTGRAALFFNLVFCHPQTQWRQVDHLSALDDVGRQVLKRVVTMLAFLDLVENHFIDLRHRLQVMALMAWLTTLLFSARFAQALLLLFSKPIRRWGDDCCGCLWPAVPGAF